MMNIRTARVTSILKRMNRKTGHEFKDSKYIKRSVSAAVLIFPVFLFYCLYDPSYPMDPVNLINIWK